MDPRITRWAKTLVRLLLWTCSRARRAPSTATPAAEPLVAEVYREMLRAGGPSRPADRAARVCTEIALREGNDEQLGWINPAERA